MGICISLSFPPFLEFVDASIEDFADRTAAATTAADASTAENAAVAVAGVAGLGG